MKHLVYLSERQLQYLSDIAEDESIIDKYKDFVEDTLILEHVALLKDAVYLEYYKTYKSEYSNKENLKIMLDKRMEDLNKNIQYMDCSQKIEVLLDIVCHESLEFYDDLNIVGKDTKLDEQEVKVEVEKAALSFNRTRNKKTRNLLKEIDPSLNVAKQSVQTITISQPIEEEIDF